MNHKKIIVMVVVVAVAAGIAFATYKQKEKLSAINASLGERTVLSAEDVAFKEQIQARINEGKADCKTLPLPQYQRACQEVFGGTDNTNKK